MSSSKEPSSIHWFRKGLRLHDNRALLEACNGTASLYPLFVLDSDPASPESRAGPLRTAFLLESLQDLDEQLRAKGSRLFVVRGKPEEVLPQLFEEWNVKKLTFEADSEPRSRARDREVGSLAKEAGVQVLIRGTSTLRNLQNYHMLMGKKQGTYLKTYGAFLKLHDNAGPVPDCAPDISGDLPAPGASPDDAEYDRFSIPSLSDLGVEPLAKALKFRGGEREALARLERVMAREDWISKFEKPKTSPNSIEPSTTVLSMYISHGCLSTRRFWHALCKVYTKKGGSKPPVSLKGQLLWKEFNYFSGYSIPSFDKMVGNPVIRQIPWDKDEEKLMAWKEARTGFPWIDAAMTQLKDEGWIHHLARHAVACFLTRGDLWQSWEDGAAVFDELLLDADWSINNFNWQWLSCSAFFYQYFRCYSPIAFGKKTDQNGDYIKKYLPALRKFPSKYIYEPWTAPLQVQRGCGCIIGKDYPKPIVDHADTSKANMAKMNDAYDAHQEAQAAESHDDGGSGSGGGGSGGGSGGGARSRARGAQPASSKRVKR
ncbi:cryptochrome 1 [Ectocarpus siliculosus]|uniref:Cryptochrome 1 n=1 Tax=Ectocarpus siliculosus TaxID=2880 RepID=D7FPP0_ECTSI|nr:cryptochrome 1 [Ectocarpus siliculosus]|eukprot:CBJ30497.1 cryptochrome 1 [Ectocarpus siliculosus]